MKRLIVTADDFGLTDGVSAGIVDAIQRGAVSCTSAMMAVPGAPERVQRYASSDLAGRIGLHLQLTGGVACAPVSSVRSLVDASGAFPRSPDRARPRSATDIAREWRAQARRLREIGITASHVDSHHYVHHAAGVEAPFAAAAAALGVPARTGPPQVAAALDAADVPHADLVDTGWFGGELTEVRLVERVERAFAALGGTGTIELVCHPGRCDAALEAISSYAGDRERELAVFCAPDLPARLADRGITIVPPSALGGRGFGVRYGVVPDGRNQDRIP